MVVNSSANATFLTKFRIVLSLPIKCKSLATRKEFLVQKYLVENLSPNQIAKVDGVSRQTIWTYLRKHKIPLRENDRVAHNQARTFGWKWRAGKRVKNSAEQKIIEKIKTLRNAGLSYLEIVKALNTMSTPTKSKDKKWHLTTVYRILKNLK